MKNRYEVRGNDDMSEAERVVIEARKKYMTHAVS